MHFKVFAIVACSLFVSLERVRAGSPVWALNFNTQINMVNPANNAEAPYFPSPFQSDSLAMDPSGTLYTIDAAGKIFSLPGAPIGNTGFTQLADLSYASGGLWGFSNAADTLFFFDLGTAAVTYSLPIASGLTGYNVTGITEQQSTGNIYLSGHTGLNADELFLLDLNTASALPVGSMTISDAFSYISDIEFDGAGTLLAMSWFHRDFYSVNPLNGATTLISSGPHRDVTALAVMPPAQLQPPPEAVPEVGLWQGALALGLLGLFGRRSRTR